MYFIISFNSLVEVFLFIFTYLHPPKLPIVYKSHLPTKRVLIYIKIWRRTDTFPKQRHPPRMWSFSSYSHLCWSHQSSMVTGPTTMIRKAGECRRYVWENQNLLLHWLNVLFGKCGTDLFSGWGWRRWSSWQQCEKDGVDGPTLGGVDGGGHLAWCSETSRVFSHHLSLNPQAAFWGRHKNP